MFDQVTIRAKTALFTRMLSLDPAVVRRLAGRPVRVDGLTLSPQTQLAMRMQKLGRERTIESGPIPVGRVTMRNHMTIVGGDLPIGDVEERTVRGAAGPLAARLYIPAALVVEEASEASRLETTADPMLVFYHGGGMIYGDLDSHDAMCRFLAERAGVRVLAVDYRLAPEHPFPAGPDDAWAAYEWVSRNAADYGADPTRLAVGGDSAGAYLSAVTALRAAETGTDLAYQLLIYPVTDMAGESESRTKFARGFVLTTEFMDKATEAYLADSDLRDPRASVLLADIPSNLAPAFVATGGFDPLRDEGEAYAQKLADAGVHVEARRYGGEIHGFANMLGVEGTAKQAMTEMAGKLAAALGSSRVVR